jgi:clan AA aspartic protease (TIGR02281 family)
MEGADNNAIIQQSLSSTSDDDVSEIPFSKESGVYKVKCKINGLPLHFVFDTGASDVTLSMVEASFMMKNGYLSGNDVIGNQLYMNADGDVNVGTVINLKDVNFGGQSLKNVRASVVRNQKAPLLLGQSVLGRLGKIEIDNQKQVLIIKPQH